MGQNVERYPRTLPPMHSLKFKHEVKLKQWVINWSQTAGEDESAKRQWCSYPSSSSQKVLRLSRDSPERLVTSRWRDDLWLYTLYWNWLYEFTVSWTGIQRKYCTTGCSSPYWQSFFILLYAELPPRMSRHWYRSESKRPKDITACMWLRNKLIPRNPPEKHLDKPHRCEIYASKKELHVSFWQHWRVR